MTRKMVDCRTIPSESNCSLTITGTADEVVRAAVRHAVDVHAHEDTEELRAEVERSLRDSADVIGREGAFIQLIEFGATEEQAAQGRQLVDRYRDEIGAAGTVAWAVATADRDRRDRYVQIVQFPSYEQAMANSEHPATRQLAEQLGKLASGDPTYRNLDVVQVQGDL